MRVERKFMGITCQSSTTITTRISLQTTLTPAKLHTKGNCRNFWLSFNDRDIKLEIQIEIKKIEKGFLDNCPLYCFHSGIPKMILINFNFFTCTECSPSNRGISSVLNDDHQSLLSLFCTNSTFLITFFDTKAFFLVK